MSGVDNTGQHATICIKTVILIPPGSRAAAACPIIMQWLHLVLATRTLPVDFGNVQLHHQFECSNFLSLHH